MSAPTRLDEYRHRRAERESDRLAFAEARQHGLRLRKEAKLRHLAARASAAESTAPETQLAVAAVGGESGAGLAEQRLSPVTRPEPAPVKPDDEETFDPGPPADAILDAPSDEETFDDCAYDNCAYDTEEEYPCDQEAC